MTAILKSPTRPSVTPRMLVLSPYELYMEQVRSISDSIRASRTGMAYVPAQFGGILGQRDSIMSQAVVQMIDFTNSGA
jgi:hypothetical protein